MAKVTRSVLKDMVKECLVEILSEGLLNTSDQLQESQPRKRRKSSKVDPEVFQKRNKMLREKTNSRPSKPSMDVTGLTDDPIMQEIFADTAATTLREQVEGKGGKTDYRPHDAAAKVVHENDLEDLFEGSQNWAALAFNDGKN